MRNLSTKHIATLLFIALLLWNCGTEEETVTPIIPVESTGSIKIIEDEFEGEPIVLAGSPFFNFIVSYSRILENDTLSFVPATTLRSLPIVMRDEAGGEWDIFGKAVSGPHRGKQLKAPFSTMGYWFVFSAFYESVELHNQPTVTPHSLAQSDREEWLIPFNQIFDGGPGFDGIPALVEPNFSTYDVPRNVDNAVYLNDQDLVIGIRKEKELRLYPHPILDWHEIVNDEIGADAFALIYCPLTGTTTVWDRMVAGQKQEFGVSGFLFNSNIIPFDRSTRSFWSQLYNKSVNGSKIGTAVNNLPHVETTWETWKIIAPSSKFLSDNTGFSRDYNRYPYGSYRTNNNLLFPIAHTDARLPLKERVHAIIVNDKVKAYRFEDFR